MITIDGTKVHANASHHCNLDYEQLARDARGDELPEHLRTREGRRAALAEAKRKLERDRAERPTHTSRLLSAGSRCS